MYFSTQNEDFVTRAIVKNKVENLDVPQNVPQNDPQNVPQNYIPENEIDKVKNLFKNNPDITRDNMAIALGKSLKTIQRLLKDNPDIKHIGSSKNGHWVIIDEDTQQ